MLATSHWTVLATEEQETRGTSYSTASPTQQAPPQASSYLFKNRSQINGGRL